MDKHIEGIAMMLVSAVAFSIMQILMAMTSGTIPLFEQMIFRNAITAVISCVSLKRKKCAAIWGRPENRPLLMLRSVLGFLAMYFLFYATAHGNQGEVAILSKLSPFVTILCAMVFLHERVRNYQKIALVVAFAGAFITADPTFGGVSLAAVSALLCSVFSGVAYFCISSLKGREDSDVTVLVFSTFTTVLCVLVTLFCFVMPTPQDFLLLLGVGVFAAIGQLTLTRAYSVAAAAEVSVFNYAGIPATMILAYLFLRQPATAASLVGSVLVIFSGVLSFLGDRAVRQEETEKECCSNDE